MFLEPPPTDADRRTAAEKRYDEQMAKREAERIAKMAEKSHRQRVAEFNAHLSSLTEHMVSTMIRLWSLRLHEHWVELPIETELTSSCSL